VLIAEPYDVQDGSLRTPDPWKTSLYPSGQMKKRSKALDQDPEVEGGTAEEHLQNGVDEWP
jgi:hypothetical protein